MTHSSTLAWRDPPDETSTPAGATHRGQAPFLDSRNRGRPRLLPASERIGHTTDERRAPADLECQRRAPRQENGQMFRINSQDLRSVTLPTHRRCHGTVGIAVTVATLMIPSMAMAATTAPGHATTAPTMSPPGVALSWGSRVGLGGGSGTRDALTPRKVALKGRDVSQIQGGCFHAIALATNGDVLTWGYNFAGQLGNGRIGGGPSFIPKVVAFDGAHAKITSVAAGCQFSLALSSAGQVLAWGRNVSGQLGTGVAGGFKPTPVPVHLPPHVRITAISAGADFSMALTTTGQLYAWGLNSLGDLGAGALPKAFSATPVQVKLPPGQQVTAVSAGDAHTLALTGSGRLYAWGANDAGQLGLRPSPSQSIPIRVPGIGSGVTAVSAGSESSLALINQGRTVLAWGDNNSGQLGTGTHARRSFQPVPVKLKLRPGVKVRAISAGLFYGMALTTNQTVLAWGRNTHGELGNGSRINSRVPVTAHMPHITVHGIARPVPVASIAAGPLSSDSYVIILNRTGS
jgi:alpha-tubulin suppressor-like RCC1 family protein